MNIMRGGSIYKGMCLLFSVGILAVASPVRAYGYVWNGIEITPRISVREAYDDNVTRVKHDAITDYITNLMAAVDLAYEEKTSNMTLSGDVVRQIFAKHSEFDNTAEHLNARYQAEVSKSGILTLTDTFLHETDPTTFLQAFGREAGRFGTYDNTFQADYHHDMTEQFFWTARYTNDWVNLTEKDISDSVMNAVGVGAGYSFSSATSLSLNYDYSIRDYNPGSSVTTHEVSGLLRRYLNKQLYLDIQGGVDVIDPVVGKRFTRPMMRVALTQEVNPTTKTGIAVEQRYTTNAYSQDIFNNWRVSGSISKDLSSRVSGSATGFYGSGRYIQTGVTERLTGINLGGSLELTRKTRLNLNYIFTHNTSNQSDASYTKNEVLLGLAMIF